MTADHRQQANQAAAEAVFARIYYAAPEWNDGNDTERQNARDVAEAAVAAAEPHLRALVAEAIRAEAERHPVPGMEYAARIAEVTQ